MNLAKIILVSVIVMGGWLLSPLCYATCSQVTGASDVRVGRTSTIQIQDLAFQPAGSIISDITKPITSIASDIGRNLETIYYRCDLADANQIYEIFYRPTSWYNTGSTYGKIYNGFFGTNMPGLGFQFYLTTTGQPFELEVQSRPIGYEVDPVNASKIVIKLKHFSGIRNLQIRTDQAVQPGVSSSIGAINRAVVAFRGPGINASYTDGSTFSGAPGFVVMTLYQVAVSAVGIKSCGVQSVPASVGLGSHKPSELPTSQVSFSVILSCQQGSTNVRYGFDPGMNNSINNPNKTNYLLPTNYGTSGVAGGVAVQIYDNTGKLVNLLQYSGASIITTGTGWYSLSVPGGSGISTIPLSFSARYVSFTGSAAGVTPGKANAIVVFMINQS
ncbi:fimbrial protein [Citrobacter koseri]|uniref:fimbrial protein n=1 Tax=Citrobacter koseri TaxID=545 RepID=UPI0006685582|nr:fimbrial protein [Citrobacter koseri]